ncbi:MAG: glyoxylase-like metal-dependent hydrolase (beta-lactamase superfamily II) [Candidatus Promineifilaceae bacterium]|jgi:glyoxylase-like metal-dependent hydrolase (beta-lactamase superfamily II)
MNRIPHTKENWFDIKDLGDGIYAIAEWGHTEEVLSFLLVGRHEAAIIDTGCGFFSIKAAVEQITQLPCKVINTHQHFDHIGNNPEFAEILMPDHPENHKRAKEGLSAEFLTDFVTADQFWGKVPAGLSNPFELAPFPQATFFKDGDILDLDPFKLKVLHTPGHCADHCCLFDQDKGILFAGDNLYDGPIFIQKKNGLAQYRQSIDILCALPGLGKIIPSHNGFDFPIAKLHQVRDALANIHTAELEETIIVDGPLCLMPVPYAA